MLVGREIQLVAFRLFVETLALYCVDLFPQVHGEALTRKRFEN